MLGNVTKQKRLVTCHDLSTIIFHGHELFHELFLDTVFSLYYSPRHVVGFFGTNLRRSLALTLKPPPVAARSSP